MYHTFNSVIRALGLFAALLACGRAAEDFAALVPAAAPRTNVIAGRAGAFRAYCTTGEGARAFQKIKADFNREHLKFPFPPGPKT